MERVKRRWWTWAVSLVATTVIAAATLSGAFQLAVLAVPSYRADLAAWVSGATGRPVQIGGINLSWSGLSPRFDLNGITLFSDDGDQQLSVERLSLGVGLRNLLVGDLVPTRLELSGLRVSAEVDEQRRIRIAGFEAVQDAPGAAEREPWLRDLDRFESVRLQNCEVRLRADVLEGEAVVIRIDDVDLERTAAGFAVAADLRLPVERGGDVHLEAEIEGSVGQLRSWRGRFEATVRDLRPQGWLRPWLLPGTQVTVADLAARVTGEVAEGRVTRARAELSSGALVLARAGVLSSAQRSNIVLDYLRNPRGWRLDVGDLSFDERLLLRGSLRRDDLDGRSAWDFDADRVDLGVLGPWAGIWRDGTPWMHSAGRGTGTLDGVIVRVRSGAGEPTTYSVRARLHDVGLRADRVFGIAGIGGELSADDSGGQLQLSSVPLSVELPAALNAPLAFDSVAAGLRWRREADGWLVSGDRLQWALASIEGQGRVEVRLPDAAGASPLLDLEADFSAGDALDARPYLPQHWPDSLKEWLTRAIVQARVARGELRIRGPVRDFPFHTHATGEWSLALDVADTALDYAPGWPRIDDIRARLLFRGNGLVITSDQAQMMGNRIRAAEVRFDDFASPKMTIDGRTSGELSRYYAFLRQSPLRRPLAALVDNTRARGRAEVDVQLRMPIDHVEQTTVTGRVTVADAELQYGALQPPISALAGTLTFTESGVEGQALSARFADAPLDLRIDPEPGTRGVIRGRFPLALQADGSGLSRFVPAFLRPVLRGSSEWSLELPLSDADHALRLRSDLVGTAVALPAPLGKAAEDAEAVQLRIGGDAAAPLRLAVSYASRIGVDVAIAEVADGWRATGVHARLGATEAPPAEADRYVLDGATEVVDLDAWIGALAGGGDGGVGLDRADLDAGQLRWGAYTTPATHLHYRPTLEGWQIDLSGDGASGTLNWRNGGGGALSARIERLDVDVQAAEPGVQDQASSPPLDPSQLPTLDVVGEQIRVGGAPLGRLELRSERVPGGQALRRLNLSGDIVALDGGGAWRRIAGQSSAELRFDLDARRIDQLLTAFRYADSLEAERARFVGEVGWAPNTDGLRWELATGHIDLDIETGQLRAVQPGASRILGLINFYALPRRLLLNFDDVVGEGLAFDRIKGRFDLAHGAAETSDLGIDGPSLRMDIRGRVGLLARDYDQRITVYPDVSAGVTLGAVLLGGPAIGALVLLAQELLDKPLDQATQLSYRVSGPWDNPRVERVEAPAQALPPR